jgi:hypothetical protein
LKKNIVIILIMATFTLPSFSQDCSEKLLAQKPGTWKAGKQGFIQNLTATDCPNRLLNS